MTKRTLKGGLVVAGCGSMLGFGGCLGGDSWWGVAARDLAMNTAWEFVLDNDAVIDFFEDDWGTGLFYDDRFTADPIRAEPN